MTEVLLATPWAITALVALLALLLAISAHRFARLVVRRMGQKNAIMRGVLQSTERPAGAAIPLLALQVVWAGAPDDLAFIGNVRHLNVLALVGAMTWYVISFIDGFANGILEIHPATSDDNLRARRVQTQTRVLARCAEVVVLIAGIAMALMTFPGARQVGASLLASAGVLGIIGGLAARPVFSNLIAGLQIALAQPLRIDDVLIVKGEWGRVEEITGTYVVLKIWDERRLIIPLQWFIENPFENWTRHNAQILGTVFLYLDYTTPVESIRQEAQRIVEGSPLWDGRVFAVQVTDVTDRAIQVRVLISASNSGNAYDLRCLLREQLLAFLAREHPQSLPLVRSTDASGRAAGADAADALGSAA